MSIALNIFTNGSQYDRSPPLSMRFKHELPNWKQNSVEQSKALQGERSEDVTTVVLIRFYVDKQSSHPSFPVPDPGDKKAVLSPRLAAQGSRPRREAARAFSPNQMSTAVSNWPTFALTWAHSLGTPVFPAKVVHFQTAINKPNTAPRKACSPQGCDMSKPECSKKTRVPPPSGSSR